MAYPFTSQLHIYAVRGLYIVANKRCLVEGNERKIR